jgi:hypothetical protein
MAGSFFKRCADIGKFDAVPGLMRCDQASAKDRLL